MTETKSVRKPQKYDYKTLDMKTNEGCNLDCTDLSPSCIHNPT